MAHHFIENSYVFHIFARRADENSIRRLKARITSVNFQPFVKPTLNAMKKVATTWINIFSPIPSLILEMWLRKPSCERSLPQGLPQNQMRGSDLCIGLYLTLLWSSLTERRGKASEERKKDEQESCVRKKRNQVANQAGLVAKWEQGSAMGQGGVKDVGTEEE